MGQVLLFENFARPLDRTNRSSSYFRIDHALGQVAAVAELLAEGNRTSELFEALSAAAGDLVAVAKAGQVEVAVDELYDAARLLVEGAPEASQLHDLARSFEAAYLQLRCEVLTATPLGW